MSSKYKGSNKTVPRTFFWTSKKPNSKKKKSFNYPKKKIYTEEFDTSSQKENLPENIQKNAIPPKVEEEYQGLVYHPQYTEIIPAGIFYIIEPTEKKEDYNNFKTKWKTEICRYWEMYGECKFGENCAFAHGDSELKQRKLTFNYKTKACKQFFELGYCSYGSRCQFSHKKESLEGKCEGGKKDEISYVKIINELNSDSKHISHDLIERPRLAAFENMAHSTLEESKSCKLKLYEDFINLKNENLNLKKNEMKKFKFSEDTLPNSNVNSDNNDIINGEE
jgi:hypothetical protein